MSTFHLLVSLLITCFPFVFYHWLSSLTKYYNLLLKIYFLCLITCLPFQHSFIFCHLIFHLEPICNMSYPVGRGWCSGRSSAKASEWRWKCRSCPASRATSAMACHRRGRSPDLRLWHRVKHGGGRGGGRVRAWTDITDWADGGCHQPLTFR